jgi:hypothetical protein
MTDYDCTCVSDYPQDSNQNYKRTYGMQDKHHDTTYKNSMLTQ